MPILSGFFIVFYSKSGRCLFLVVIQKFVFYTVFEQNGDNFAVQNYNFYDGIDEIFNDFRVNFPNQSRRVYAISCKYSVLYKILVQTLDCWRWRKKR